MATINFSQHPAGKCFLVTSDDRLALRKLMNATRLSIRPQSSKVRSMFKWNQILEAWTIQKDIDQDSTEELFADDGYTITHVERYTPEQIDDFHSNQVQNLSNLYQESIQAAKDKDADKFLTLQEKVHDLSKPFLLTDIQLQEFYPLIPDEEICLSCESGCSPGHDYDHNCCFMQPGLTWEDAALEAQQQLLSERSQLPQATA